MRKEDQMATPSFNHYMQSYDLHKGEFPRVTLRPILAKTAKENK